MKIRSLYIKEFAGICERIIELDDGLNIIEGENESGKSTILSFIKFMLYGLPQKRVAGSVTEKDRAFSWKNGVASGSMTVSTEKGDLRIERTVRSGTRSEELNVIDLVSGTPVHKGEVPGELFLGVPLAVFESSACVKQLACSSLDGIELGSAVENLLLSADEALNTQKSVERLDSERKKLLHKTGRGGSINTLTLECETLRTKLGNAKKKAELVREYEALLEKYSNICAETRTSLAEDRRLCDAYDKRQQQIRLESIKSTRSRIDGISEEYDSYKAEKCYLGFVPDHDFLIELSDAENDCVNAINEEARRKEEAENAKADISEEDVAKSALADAIDELGGESAVPDEYSECRSKRTQTLALSLTFLGLSLMFALLCTLYALGKELPGLLSGRFVFPSLAVLGGLFAVLAVVFFIVSGRKKTHCAEICGKTGLDGIVPKETLLTHIGECMGARAKCENRRAEEERTRLGYEASVRQLAEKREKLGALLEKVGERLTGDEGKDEITRITENVKERSAVICRDIEEYERDLAKYTTLYEERSREAGKIDERALGAALTPEVCEKLAGVNITNLRRETEFLESKLETAEQKRGYYDRELIGLHATAENPLKAELMLAKAEARLGREKEVHDALTLAYDSILSAAESMRRNITPMIRTRAGEMLSALTCGKYRSVGIASDFKITIEVDGAVRPVEAMSAGTRDAVYLAVRLALVSVLYRNEMPPMLLDEVLAQIDDKRAGAILSMLSRYSAEGKQCVLLTCQTREETLVDANVVKL